MSMVFLHRVAAVATLVCSLIKAGIGSRWHLRVIERLSAAQIQLRAPPFPCEYAA